MGFPTEHRLGKRHAGVGERGGQRLGQASELTGTFPEWAAAVSTHPHSEA